MKIALLVSLSGQAGGLISEPSCQLPAQPGEDTEPAWLAYLDLSCVGDTGLVDDSALFEARLRQTSTAVGNVSTLTEAYVATKVASGLQRPTGVELGGGEIFWMEQDLGAVRRCALDAASGQCVSSVDTVLDGLHCPQDLAVDFHRGRLYVIQYEGRSADDAPERCYGTPRITRATLSIGADGEAGIVDVLANTGSPTALALDPLGGPDGAGYLFWTDSERDLVLRSGLNGSDVHEVVHDSSPSGLAVDPSRASLYYTSHEAGAGLMWSNYEGRHPPPRHIFEPHERVLFEPIALALDAADGSVYVVQTDTYEPSCDVAANDGYGAVTCDTREQGRVTRVSCTWKPELTIDGEAAAPHECCCHDPTDAFSPCRLNCLPSPPPSPPRLPPGEYNASAVPPSPPPTLRGDLSWTTRTDEVMLDVGGRIVAGAAGTSSLPWGDPTQLALLPAVRLLPVAVGAPRSLAYGNCTPGCGRPAGGDGCRACLAGSYGLGDGICRLCRPGTFGNASESAFGGFTTAADACEACGGGTYAPSFGASVCRDCPAGHLCNDGYELTSLLTLEPVVPAAGAIPLPTACPRGTYNPSTRRSDPSACLACTAGRFRPGSAGVALLSSCDLCEAGHFSGAPGAHVCDACAPSTFAAARGSAGCAYCARGQYTDASAATQCEDCPRGRYGVVSDDPAVGPLGVGAPSCVDCDAGTYSDGAGSTVCALCPAGTIGELQAATNLSAGCTPCPDGSYNLFEAQLACLACPVVPTVDENVSSPTYMEELPPPNGCVFELSAAPLSRRCGSLGPLLAALAAGGMLAHARTRAALHLGYRCVE